MEEAEFIWMNGSFVAWKEAKIHALTKGLHYGYAVFEGMRCYKTDKGAAIFRLREHVKRLLASAAIMRMPIKFSRNDFENACVETVKRNNLDEAYLRPLIYLGYGAMGMDFKGVPIDSLIAAFSLPTYLGEEALRNGISIRTSSFRRHNINPELPKAKNSGNYPISILAKTEALDSGYQDALLLDHNGFVCECSAENVFMVKNSELVTPPIESALAGITRASIMEIAQKMGIPVREGFFTKEEMCEAEEAFMTGTAAELTPITGIDGNPIGKGRPGETTKELQQIFFDAVRGKKTEYVKWLTYVK